MKKIFTLLFAVGTISIASAQSKGFDHSKQVPGYAQNEKHEDLQKFNRVYSYKMEAGKNRHLPAGAQSKQSRRLENHRRQEMARMQYRFEKNNHRHGDNRFAKSHQHHW